MKNGLTILACIIGLCAATSVRGVEPVEWSPEDAIWEVRDPATGFVHPGIGLTRDDVLRIIRFVKEGVEPWKSDYEWLVARDGRFSFNPGISTDRSIEKAIDNQWFDRACQSDSIKALCQAFMYIADGDIRHREYAMDVVRWFYRNIKGGGPHWDSQFRWPCAERWYLMACELLRYSGPRTGELAWTDEDTAGVNEFISYGENLWWGKGMYLNQLHFALGGPLARGIWRNDRALYDEMVEVLTYNKDGPVGGCNGSIREMCRLVVSNDVTGVSVEPHYQFTEMGRDIGHPFPGAGALADNIIIVRSQNTMVDPVYGTVSAANNAVAPLEFLGDRFLKGVNQICKYNLGAEIFWTPIYERDAAKREGAIWAMPSNWGGGRGRLPNLMDVLYSHYRWKRNYDFESSEDTRYIGYGNKLNVYDIFYRFFWMVPEAAGKWHAENDNPGCGGYNRFAEFILQPSAGVSKKPDDGAGMDYVSMKTNKYVFSMFLNSRRPFPSAGEYVLRYRSSGKCGIATINPEDYETEYYDGTNQTQRIYVEELSLPSTGGAWKDYSFRLEKPVERNLARLEFRAESGEMDVAWLRVPEAADPTRNEWRPQSPGAANSWGDAHNWSQGLDATGCDFCFSDGASVMNRKATVLFDRAFMCNGAIKVENDLRNDGTGELVFKASSSAAGATSRYNIVIGSNVAPGNLHVESGSFRADNAVLLQNGRSVVEGGVLEAANNFHMGYGQAGKSELDVAGGETRVGNSMFIGCVGGLHATCNVTDGLLYVNNLCSIGEQYNTSELNVTGGRVHVGGDFVLARAANSTGICRVMGGALEVNSVAAGSGKSATLLLDGGWLRTNRSQSPFIADGDVLRVFVGEGGACFDTAGFDVAVPAKLRDADGMSSPGTIAKRGLGTLTISSDLALARTFRFEIDGGIGPVALTGTNTFGNGDKMKIEIIPTDIVPGTTYTLMTGLPSSVSLSSFTLPSNGFYSYSWSLSGGTLRVSPAIASGYAATARYVKGGWWIFDANGKDFHGSASRETVFIFSGVEPAGEFARMASGKRVSIEVAKSNGRGVTNTVEVASSVAPASLSISCESGCAVRFVGSGSARISTERFSNGGSIVVGGSIELDVAPLSGICHVESGAKLTLASSQTVSATFSGEGTVAFADGEFSFAGFSAFGGFPGLVEIADGSRVNAPLSGQDARLGSGSILMSGGILYLGNDANVNLENDIVAAAGTSSRIWSNQANMFMRGDMSGSGTLCLGTNGNRGPRLQGDNSAFSGRMVLRLFYDDITYAASSSASAAWCVETDGTARDLNLYESGVFRFGSLRVPSPLAGIVAKYAGTEIVVGSNGDSFIGGRLAGEPVDLLKVGSGTCLTFGESFNAVAGTAICAEDGAIGFALPRGDGCASLTNCTFNICESVRLRVEMTKAQYGMLSKDAPCRVVARLAKAPRFWSTTEICVDGHVVETARPGNLGWHVAYRYVVATPDVAAHYEAVLEYGTSVPPTAGNASDNEWQVTGGIGASTEWANWRCWTKPLGEGLNSRFGSGSGVYNRNVLVTFAEACQGDGEIKFENDERGDCVGCVTFRAESDDAGVRTASGKNIVLGWNDMRGCLETERGTYSAGNAIIVQSGALSVLGGSLSCGGNMHVSYGQARNASLRICGGTLSVGNVVEIGCAGGYVGTAEMSGGVFTSGRNFRVGIGGDASFRLEGGVVNCGNEFWLGNGEGRKGEFTMEGGEFTSASYTCVGYNRASGVFTMNGGVFTENSQKFIIGQGTDSNASGVCTVNGGRISAPQLWLAERQTPGTLNMDGGEFIVSGTAQMSRNSISGRGTINLNGGVLAVSRFEAGNASGAGGEIVFNGGTLKAIASSSNFIPASDTIDLVIAENGAVLDTAGFYVTVADSFANAEGLNGNGKIVKKGLGTLTLSATLELSRTFGFVIDGGVGPIALTASNNTLANNARISVAVDSVNVDETKSYTLITGLNTSYTIANNFTLPESDGFHALEWTLQGGALSVRFSKTDSSPVTARYADRKWNFYNASGELIDGASGSDETTYIFTGAEPSNDLVNLAKTNKVVLEAVRSGGVAVTNKIAVSSAIVCRDISISTEDGCAVQLNCSGNAALRMDGFSASANMLVSGSLESNVSLAAGSVVVLSGGRFKLETPQTIGASVSGSGILALSGGEYSFSSVAALAVFSGRLELGDGVRLNAPMDGETPALGGALVAMRGAELYCGTPNGVKLTNQVDVAETTENLIRADKANIFVRGALSGAGTLTVRTDGWRGPRLDADNSQFAGTIVLRNTSTQPDTGFRRPDAVNANARYVVESDDQGRVYDIAGGGTHRFGALVQEDVTTTFRVVNSGTKVEIGARDGEVSVLNGAFTNNKVNLKKVGETSSLKLGPRFAAVDGTQIEVAEGQLGFTFDISGERVLSLANCSFSVAEDAYLRLDMTSADFAALNRSREYPVSVLPSLPGTVNSLVYVDGALTEGTVADAWRLVAASQGSGAVLKLKYVESEKGEDGHGNLFTLPPGWRSGFPGGVTSSTMVEGRTYTYAQAYALGLATANDLSANEQVSALVATIATEDGVHGKSVSVALVSPPTPLDGYNVVCHLVKSPSLSPWSGTEVTTAAFGDAMRDDVASADKMFYKVWVEIKDRK